MIKRFLRLFKRDIYIHIPSVNNRTDAQTLASVDRMINNGDYDTLRYLMYVVFLAQENDNNIDMSSVARYLARFDGHIMRILAETKNTEIEEKESI